MKVLDFQANTATSFWCLIWLAKSICGKRLRLRELLGTRHPLLFTSVIIYFVLCIPKLQFPDLAHTIKTEPKQFYSTKFAFKMCFLEDSLVNLLAILKKEGKTVKIYNDNDTKVPSSNAPKNVLKRSSW